MNLVLFLAAFAADPLPSPWDFESQVKASPTIKRMMSDIAEIKAATVRTGASQPATAKVVVKADGTCVCQVCDANGCREIGCDCSAVSNVALNATPGFTSVPCATCPGGVMLVQNGASPGQYVAAAGGCASGNCGSGGCASGECGSSGGRRGFHPFRRR